MTVTLPEFFNVTEGDTFQVCASVNEGDVILMFTLTPDSEFASKQSVLQVTTCSYRVQLV